MNVIFLEWIAQTICGMCCFVHARDEKLFTKNVQVHEFVCLFESYQTKGRRSMMSHHANTLR